MHMIGTIISLQILFVGLLAVFGTVWEINVAKAQTFCLWDCAVDHGYAERQIREIVDGQKTNFVRIPYAVFLGKRNSPVRLLSNRKKLEDGLAGRQKCSGACQDFRRMKDAGLIASIQYIEQNNSFFATIVWTMKGIKARKKYAEEDNNGKLKVALGERKFVQILRSYDGVLSGIRFSKVAFDYKVIQTPWGEAARGAKIGYAFGLEVVDIEAFFGKRTGFARFVKASDGWQMKNIDLNTQ